MSLSSAQAQGLPVFMPVSESAGPVHKEGSLGALIDESPQKKLPNQKATPPPSPLLSELLKKGSLLSASPRLVSILTLRLKSIFFPALSSQSCVVI